MQARVHQNVQGKHQLVWTRQQCSQWVQSVRGRQYVHGNLMRSLCLHKNVHHLHPTYSKQSGAGHRNVVVLVWSYWWGRSHPHALQQWQSPLQQSRSKCSTHNQVRRNPKSSSVCVKLHSTLTCSVSYHIGPFVAPTPNLPSQPLQIPQVAPCSTPCQQQGLHWGKQSWCQAVPFPNPRKLQFVPGHGRTPGGWLGTKSSNSLDHTQQCTCNIHTKPWSSQGSQLHCTWAWRWGSTVECGTSLYTPMHHKDSNSSCRAAHHSLANGEFIASK